MRARFATLRNNGIRKTRLGCLYAFLAPFFAVGLLFLGVGVNNLRLGKTREGLFVAGFAILFLAFAGLFLAFGIWSRRNNQAQIRLQQEHPAAPWFWRPDWRKGRIRSSEGKSALLFWVMAVGFIGVSLPAVLAIPKELEKGNKPILIALVFPLAGFGLGAAAALTTLRRRKFGHSELELHTLPGVLGGTLSGALEISSKVRAETGFTLRLVCIRRTTSGVGKNRSTQERVLWEEQKTIVKDFLEDERDKTGLPVFFNVPFYQPESLDGNPAIVWRLEVTADVPGVDYAAQFVVPVFKTAESRANATLVADPTASFQPPPETWAPSARSRIQVTESMKGETVIHFPPARNVSLILGLLVFLAIWSGALWLMIAKKAPLLFPIIFGLFELLLIVVAFQMLFHAVKVVVNRAEIQVKHQLLLLGWQHRLAAEEIRAIELKPGMQSGTKVFYDLQLHTKAGRRITAGNHIPDKRHAEWLVRLIKEVLGQPA